MSMIFALGLANVIICKGVGVHVVHSDLHYRIEKIRGPNSYQSARFRQAGKTEICPDPSPNGSDGAYDLCLTHYRYVTSTLTHPSPRVDTKNKKRGRGANCRNTHANI